MPPSVRGGSSAVLEPRRARRHRWWWWGGEKDTDDPNKGVAVPVVPVVVGARSDAQPWGSCQTAAPWSVQRPRGSCGWSGCWWREGADVNGSSLRGETPLLAACKSLQHPGVETGADIVKVINYLLQNKADPNCQDQSGRTALMLACAQRATAVVSGLLRAGADPTVQDQCGASALVYAARAQHTPTLKLILEASRDMGRDIVIVIAADTIANGTNLKELTQDHLSVPPSPDPAPLCTSPSDVVLKTRDVFTFRGDGSRGAHSPSSPGQRAFSEPWLNIPHQAHLHRDHKRGIRQRDHPDVEEHHPGISQSLLTLSDPSSTPPDRFPPCPAPGSWGRRNTLPSLTAVPSMLRFPPLNGKDRSQKFASKVGVLFVPRPPSSAPPPSSKGSTRAAILKPRVTGSPAPSPVAPTEACKIKNLGKHVRRGQQ
ncbi:ankyrin repeat domain-containing protein 34A-like [Boleophthalmus pectinirostris]|uniref:ankyrin repeat domain-containing protein 34A-like n=1 Tax=Boleophthalmus pectinirostris TaxID=150288 RepID=UPI002430FFB4|nr:ankyrin repeat domain-containing protein 34A-like [Boleophthalmus pectinirostris]